MKRVVAVLLIAILLIAASACDSSEPCAFCGDEATKHYSSLPGVVYVCDECYEAVKAIEAAYD